IRDMLVDSNGAPLTVNAAGKLVVPGTSTPPPPPPPPPGAGTLIGAFGDFQYDFVPGGYGPPKQTGDFEAQGGGFLHTMTTPYGPGWDVKSTGLDVAIWDSTTKAILAKKVWSSTRVGKTEHWQFMMMLPTQTFVPAAQ